MEFVSRTERGRDKAVNEDRLLIHQVKPDGGVIVVADGLGGHPGGEVAASIVIETIGAEPLPWSQGKLHNALITASEKIMVHGAAHPDIDGMGSTATLGLIEKTRVCWAHVGDGRLYHLQNDQLRCVTRDQTLSRQLYDLGKISWEEIGAHKLNHFLEQCLGEDDIIPEYGSFKWQPDDLLLLSTDGLHDMVSDATIRNILTDNSSLAKKADRLLEEAMESGGTDDISLILCRLG